MKTWLAVLARASVNRSEVVPKSSGVKVDDECQTEYEKLKLKHQYSYVIFRLSDDNRKIIVDVMGQKGSSFQDFQDELIKASTNCQGRYAVLDCEYAKGKASKLVFIMWLSDNAVGMKQKMLYTSSKKALIDKLTGIAKDIQCNDLDDLSWSNIVEQCKSKYD